MTNEQDRIDINKITPEQARSKLEYMGFFDNRWDEIMKKGFSGKSLGSHEVRALITIARGEQPQVLGEIYNQMRINDGEKPVEIKDRLRSERKR